MKSLVESRDFDITNLVTKDQLNMLGASLREEISKVRTEITNVRSELKEDIAEVRIEVANLRTEMKDEIAKVHVEIAAVKIEVANVSKAVSDMKYDIVKWLIALTVTIIGTVITIFLGPH